MTSADSGSLVWVHATGQDSIREVHANKRKVRQQVRKHVGDQWKTSRKHTLEIRHVVIQPAWATQTSSGSEGSQNPSCSSVVSQSPTTSKKSIGKVFKSDEAVPRMLAGPLTNVMQPAAVDYSAARARYNFDLSWLSGLTISHVGSMRSAEESLSPWLRQRETTFLDLVPVHYGHSRLLQSVVDSILAKAAYTMQPGGKTRNRSLWTYGLALERIREGLRNKEVAKSTEMLCAIRMLQLCELLEATTVPLDDFEGVDPERRSSYSSTESVEDQSAAEEIEDRWTVTGTHRIGSHSQGMQSLVSMREPTSFKTDLDKSLLCSLLEGFWLQDYLNNTDFFLERPEWSSFVHALGNDTEVVRHPIALNLWLVLAPLPRLLRQSDVCMQTDDLVGVRERLLAELKYLHLKLSSWICNIESSRSELIFSTPLYNELLGFGLGTLAIACRVLVALDPISPSALQFEAEAQTLCQRTFALFLEHIISSGFFVGVCSWATSDQWQHAIECARRNGDRLIDKEVWAKWNGMMGRKPHSERRDTPWRKEVDDTVKRFLKRKLKGLEPAQPAYTGLVWYL